MSKTVKNWTYPDDFTGWIQVMEWTRPSGSHYMALMKPGTELSAVIHKDDNEVAMVFDKLVPIYIGPVTEKGIKRVFKIA